MRKLGVTLSAVLIVMTAPVLVAAADLFTPVLLVQQSTGDLILCTVLNVSSTSQSVISRLMKLENGVPVQVGGGSLDIFDPGEGTGFGQGSSGIDFFYCKFTVDGPKGAIRAGALMKPGNTFHPAQ
jgi:hypothetical protein